MKGLFGLDVIIALMRLGSGAEAYASSRAGNIAFERLSVPQVEESASVYADIIFMPAWMRAQGE